MKKIGILYDNISGNTGDLAIGLSVKKILRDLEIEYDELTIGQFSPLDYTTILIGGGHLLRSSPDYIYDKFKVHGNHILNTVGIVGNPLDLSYLEEYIYVSVRSNGDKAKLPYLQKDVHVVPCTSLLLEDLPDLKCPIKTPSIGIHLFPIFKSAEEEQRFVTWANSLPFSIYFIPITHYNQDINFMNRLSARIKNSQLLPIMNPLEIFTLIGKFDYFISCSLHGGYFSYAHNNPFLLYNYNDKMAFFMEDRGVQEYLFTNSDEIIEKFDLLVRNKPDYLQTLSRDRTCLDKHIAVLESLLPRRQGLIQTQPPATHPSQITYLQQYADHLQNVVRHEESQKNALLHEVEQEKTKINDLELQAASTSEQLRQEQARAANLELQAASTSEQLRQEQASVLALNTELAHMKRSITWQAMTRFQRVVIDRLMKPGSRSRKIYLTTLKGGRILVNEGHQSLWNHYKKSREPKKIEFMDSDYNDWIRRNEPDMLELKKQKKKALKFSYRPKISVITPVYNPSPRVLDECIQSVMHQTYGNWELCISDGNSDQAIQEVLDNFSRSTPKIKIIHQDKNLGISGNSNEALKLATGEYIALLDHDDLLAPNAFYEVVQCLNADRDLDFVYTDKDLVTEDGKYRFQPLFKPDWSPEIMLTANYLTHLTVIRKRLVDEAGGFVPEMDGAQDWDLFNKITEKTNRIHHVQKVLYHWRESSKSCAMEGYAAKPFVPEAQKSAIRCHLQRCGLSGDVIFDPIPRILWNLKRRYRVSIIIPTKDNVHLLEACINSILLKSTYENFEILIIDTGSTDPETLNYLHEIEKNPQIKVLRYDRKFNYSAVNNLGARSATGEVLIFLNDDTEILSPSWLEDMLGFIQNKEIGIIGPKLLKPDGSIQHAGVVIGLMGFAGHPFAGCFERYMGPYGSVEWYRNYLAVTGACMMIHRGIFEKAGGFDESFTLNGSDVALCLKVRELGRRVVYTPFVRLIHHEGATRERCMEEIPARDFQVSLKYYEPYLRGGDPYYNPNLSQWSTVPRLRGDERSALDFVQEVIRNVANE